MTKPTIATVREVTRIYNKREYITKLLTVPIKSELKAGDQVELVPIDIIVNRKY